MSGSVTLTTTDKNHTETITCAACHSGSLVLVTFVDAGHENDDVRIKVRNIREGAFDVMVKDNDSFDLTDRIHYVVINK